VLFTKVGDQRLHAFLALLVTIVVTIMVVPLFIPDTAHLMSARILTSASLVLALWAAGIRPRALLLFVPILIGYLGALEIGGPLRPLTTGVRLVFFGSTTVLIVRHIVRAQKVTADTIAGAACAYVLTALTWGTMYELLESLRPGSFDIPPTLLLPPAGDPSFALVYFSFTTLTTVGYGDVHPLSIGAGGLAIGEAVVGQLYVAIMIARLVGLQLVQGS
jgi:hypothetical protein